MFQRVEHDGGIGRGHRLGAGLGKHGILERAAKVVCEPDFMERGLRRIRQHGRVPALEQVKRGLGVGVVGR
ncbi:hypothetical protein ACU4HD_43540 [Cupriavidus basilensis]